MFLGTASIAVALFPNYLLLAAMESWVGAEDEAKMQSFRFRKVLPCFACNPMQEHNTTSSQQLLCYMSPNNVSDTVLVTWQWSLPRAGSFWTRHTSNIVMYTTLRSRTQTITYATSSCYRAVVSMGFLGKQPCYHGDLLPWWHGDLLLMVRGTFSELDTHKVNSITNSKQHNKQ